MRAGIDWGRWDQLGPLGPPKAWRATAPEVQESDEGAEPPVSAGEDDETEEEEYGDDGRDEGTEHHHHGRGRVFHEVPRGPRLDSVVVDVHMNATGLERTLRAGYVRPVRG